MNLKDTARAYEPPQTKNIAELNSVNLNLPIESRTGKDREGSDFTYWVVITNGEEYRVPASVLKDIKAILDAKPDIKTVKVLRKGEGMKTQYTVVPLD